MTEDIDHRRPRLGIATMTIAATALASVGSTIRSRSTATMRYGGPSTTNTGPLYFVDAQGHIRHHQFGEGDYEQSEIIIQQLLVEAENNGMSGELVTVDAHGVEAAADWASLKSPENYVGYERTENFASPGGAVSVKRHRYAVPARLRLNG